METDDKQSAMDESTATSSTADAERLEKEERARLAAERRAKIMAQMATAQKTFMSTNAELFETSNAAPSSAAAHGGGMDWDATAAAEEESSRLSQQPICLGPNRRATIVEDQMYTCILCSEDSLVSNTSACMVYSAFVQKSTVLAHVNDRCASPHTGSCGHVMHATCWKNYFENEMLKEQRRPNRTRSPGIFLIDRQEFLCPMCRCLSNAVLPIAPMLSRYIRPPPVPGSAMQTDQLEDDNDFGKWIAIMENYNIHLHNVSCFSEISIAEDVSGTATSVTATASATPPEGGEAMSSSSLLSTPLGSLNAVLELSECFVPLTQPINRDIVSAELETYIELFIQSLRKVVPYRAAAEHCEPYLVTWLSSVYTIQSVEMCLRAMNKSLSGQMSIRQTSCLAGLIRASGLLGVCANNDICATLTTHFIGLLETLFDGLGTPVIEWDVFKMLATLIFMSPTVMAFKAPACGVPHGSALDHNYMQLMFVTNVAKILILCNVNCEQLIDDDDDVAIDEEVLPTLPSESKIVQFFLAYNFYHHIDDDDGDVGKSTRRRIPSQPQLIDVIKRDSETFLRCACLLFHYITDVPMPDAFEELGGDTFDGMCSYLGLPVADQLVDIIFNNTKVHAYMRTLAEHSTLQEMRRNKDTEYVAKACVPCVQAVRQLQSLPDDYSDLINSVSTFTCPNNDRDDTRNPTTCLVCGKILCSMTYCCQQECGSSTFGACTYHAIECGAGVGLFLRIRDSEILLLGMNKGSFMSAPYLDEYGETDQGLRRGNPLRLCPERLQKLHLLWLTHGLHEEIARSAETNQSVIQTQWQNM